jgi:hypothetical protein
MKPCKYAIVGEESPSNLRLSQIVQKVYGKESVARFLELQHLEPFLAANEQYPIVVCLDLFSYALKEATDTIGRIRDMTYPKVVFNLYLDQDEYRAKSHELPECWQDRFLHYFKTFKEVDDVDYEPIVRASLRPAQIEAMHNMAYEPIRLTPIFTKGVVEPEGNRGDESQSKVAFISYSRKDWEGFVSKLVSDLSNESQKVWLDQDYIVGGDDWMDAIGEALEVCDTLLLVLSPEALTSRYVKMEYRHFFRQEKPIIPILYRQVGKMPFELASLHYLDFTQGDRKDALSKLLKVLSRHRGP